MELFNDNTKGAVISECGNYRYSLWRIWDDTKPMMMFIMINPSKADADNDDPTIRRCIGFAKSWGYGGFYVGNLFGYRATDPKELKKVDNPRGRFNYDNLLKMSRKSDIIVCAWGNKLGAPSKEIQSLGDLYYISVNNDGTPGHPLFLKGDLNPQPFNPSPLTTEQ